MSCIPTALQHVAWHAGEIKSNGGSRGNSTCSRVDGDSRPDSRRYSSIKLILPQRTRGIHRRLAGVADRTRMRRLTCAPRSIPPKQVGTAFESDGSPRLSLAGRGRGGTRASTAATRPLGERWVAKTPRFPALPKLFSPTRSSPRAGYFLPLPDRTAVPYNHWTLASIQALEDNRPWTIPIELRRTKFLQPGRLWSWRTSCPHARQLRLQPTPQHRPSGLRNVAVPGRGYLTSQITKTALGVRTQPSRTSHPFPMPALTDGREMTFIGQWYRFKRIVPCAWKWLARPPARLHNCV
jgi:hypothetical protein